MTVTYTLTLIAASAINDDVSLLAGHKNLWRVDCQGKLVAYCVDKSFADRIAEEDMYRPTIAGTGNLFAYPSTDAPVALCIGTVNLALMQSE
ncbi:hypothetical protein ACM1ZW_19630 [Pseudomonas sp. NFX71]|uniref:hypothetical protein n=1 Tax=Pseudomonas sp. NFX71 TaxID=3399121 RepID=UPI003A8A410A